MMERDANGGGPGARTRKPMAKPPSTRMEVTVHDLGTEAVHLEVADGVAVVTLNRANRLNAINESLLAGLRAAWDIARCDDAVNVVVLTGAGRAFCAGADLDELLTEPPSLRRLLDPMQDLRPDRGLQLHKPVIAAINGACLGGGLTLALAADIRMASSTASFATPEVGWGVLASCGGTQRLINQVPSAIAMHLLLSGERIGADQALQWGLVSHVYDGAELLEKAVSYARLIAAKAPLAVQATKELAQRSHHLPIEDGLRLEDLMVRLLQDTRDAREGLTAWSEQRRPDYAGE